MEVITQLMAARASLEAALVAVDTAIELEGRGISEVPDDEIKCEHTNSENASAMMGEPRKYCSDCRHFVYPGGRTVRAD